MDPAAAIAAHRPEVVRCLARRLGDAQTAEDVFQETFARARLEMVRNERAILAWFRQVLVHAAVDHHRKQSTRARMIERLAGEPVFEADAPNGVCRCIARLAPELKPEYARALEEIEIGGKTAKDFAVAHGLGAHHAGVRIDRARKALRREVKATCGRCMKAGCNPGTGGTGCTP